MNWKPIPIPHRTVPEPRGQDLDFINVAHSHLIHTEWPKLRLLSTGLTPLRVKHILLKIQKDHVLYQEFFNWVGIQKPSCHTLETQSIILHILTKNRKFKSAESILRNIMVSCTIDVPLNLFEEMLHSYRFCDSSPGVFDSLFKTLAHMKKFRNATDIFCRMKDYGFFPIIESCNAYMSSLLDLQRTDIALAFYREFRHHRISPNVYTLNMLMRAYCKLGKVEKPLRFSGRWRSWDTAIRVFLNFAIKLRNSMEKNGLNPSVVTFNTLIHGFCKEGKLQEASKVFIEMKAMNVAPNTVTYNTLINGYSPVGDSDISGRLYEEMLKNQVKADILTYNALILGLCKEGKAKKAAYLVKELDKENLVPNASTFSALIYGQCMKKNSERAFHIYQEHD
ncbi:hypothetical protein CJ030_MR6G016127 [Morella rubra]|uniref:Pentatricopeptide repeat-containing protein n=1 Tax=Morella rubra TaxID=262757 RepID=A0A6A1V935_9ROSI|nr:hypothetical protein CJ030_MR6G016127 [Morella rubra]